MSAPAQDYALPSTVTVPTEKHAPPISALQNGIQQARDENKGATVHNFNPTDTPQQKAQQALKEGNAKIAALDTNLPSLPGPPKNPSIAAGGTALPTDVNTADNIVTPTTHISDALALANDDQKVAAEVPPLPDHVPVPGTLPDPAVGPREIPDWFKIGWSGQHREDPFATVSEIADKSLLADFVDEAYYGAWFHNAAIIVFAVVTTHFLTLFGGGLAALMIVLAVCTTYYQTSMRRTRRNARDDMAREVAKTGLRSDVESATWMNLFMTRFWIIYEPVLSATIVASVDQVLSISTPSFLNSIRMTTFTLGTKPPRIDHVRTFPDTAEDIIVMEWAISFTPNDVLDMTSRQAIGKVNPKVVITIKLGVGPAVVGKDIVVEDLAFSGTMRVKVKLMNNYPHVQLVDLSFMAPPTFDFVLKPVGFDLSIIPGLTPFINSQLHATLGPMMYDPNVFTLNLEQMLSGEPIDTAVGVLVLTIRSARGTKGVKMGGGAPDPYVSVAIGQRAELARTTIKKSTTTPNWKETKYLLLNNLNDVLSLTVKDWNEHRKDADLGIANFDLKSLVEDGQQENVSVPIMLEGKARGELIIDAVYYPVLKPKKLADGTLDIIPETKTGVVRLVVHQGKDLEFRDKQIDPFFKVLLNNVVTVHRSQTLKRTPNPVWENPCEFLVTDKSTAVVGVQVYDDNTFGGNSSLGYMKIKLNELLEANAKQLDWFPLNGAKSGRIRISAEWKPVLMVGAINGAGSYTAPIGVIRLWFKRGIDLKNVEALTGGKSDPYVRCLRSGIVIGRTLVVDNNLDPEWDEIVYVQVHASKETFTLEVMDYQHQGKDRSLGVAELSVAALVAEGSDKKHSPWVSTGVKNYKEMLKSDGKKTVKGSIEFEARFYPATHLKNVSFDEIAADTISEEQEPPETPPKTPPTVHTNGVSTTGTPGSTTTRHSVSDSVSAAADAAKALADEAKAKMLAEEGVVVPRAELLKTQSGIIAFQILSGELSRRGARLEVAFNSGYWPAYSTEHSRSTHCKWDEIGEFLITELDYATISLKLNTAEKETREDIIASYTGDLNDFLESSLDKPATFTLTDAAGGSRNTVRICCKYIPVPMELDPRESVNNSGTLRIELLDGKDIPSADRSGKSDPFVIFEMNGTKVHKSEVIKKTLTPVWNETIETTVNSRTAAKFYVDVFDWDRLGADTKLGRGQIDLTTLEPFEQTVMVIPLGDKGKQQGSIRIKVIFRPGFIARARGATSTFSSLGGRALTGIGGGVGAGAHGVGSIGKGVGRGIGGIGKGILGRKSSSPLSTSQSFMEENEIPSVPAVPADLKDIVVAPAGNHFNGVSTPPPSNGVLAITIVHLSGSAEPEEKKSIQVRAHGKVVESTHAHKGEVATYNETFSVKTSSVACELDFSVLHKKTFGADKLLGTAVLQAWDHIKASEGVVRATLELPLTAGSGSLQVLLEWSPSFGNAAAGIEDDRASIAQSITASTRKSRISSNRFSFAKRDREPSVPTSEE